MSTYTGNDYEDFRSEKRPLCVVCGVDYGHEHDEHVLFDPAILGGISFGYYAKLLVDGQVCYHIACSSHISHPCEGCGRYGARGKALILVERLWTDSINQFVH